MIHTEVETGSPGERPLRRGSLSQRFLSALRDHGLIPKWHGSRTDPTGSYSDSDRDPDWSLSDRDPDRDPDWSHRIQQWQGSHRIPGIQGSQHYTQGSALCRWQQATPVFTVIFSTDYVLVCNACDSCTIGQCAPNPHSYGC